MLTNFLVCGGIANEGNQFLLPLVGEPGPFVLKVVSVLVCTFILWDIHRRYPRLVLASTSLFASGYGVIVAWKLAMLISS